MLYGSDHVSKTERKDGGPNRNTVFAPLALRLERSVVNVFSLLTVPLSGMWQWRGRRGNMFWTPTDASLSTGESLDTVLVRAGRPKFLFVQPRIERIKLPSDHLNSSALTATCFSRLPTPFRTSASLIGSTGSIAAVLFAAEVGVVSQEWKYRKPCRSPLYRSVYSVPRTSAQRHQHTGRPVSNRTTSVRASTASRGPGQDEPEDPGGWTVKPVNAPFGCSSVTRRARLAA